MARKRKRRSGGQYEVKVIIGRDIHGKPIRKSFYSSHSVAEARKKAEGYKATLSKEKSSTGDSAQKSATFSEWAETWLTVYKQPFVSAATYRSTYEAYVHNHMMPFFGNALMCDITQADVQRYFSSKAGKSQSFLNKNRFMLSAIFESAAENGLCERNPVKHIKYSSTQIKREKKALTDEQMIRLERLAAEKQRPEIIFLLHTGLRRGELCGLQWTDIDLKHKTLRVRRAIAEHGGKCCVNPPKFNSRRVIPLDDTALSVLQQQPRKSIWIFASRTGDFCRPDAWTDRLESFMRKAPADLQCTSHELRHTYGSWLRRHGVDIYTIQKILGHKDINVTAGIYIHADINSMRAEIDRINYDFFTTKESQ